MQNWMTQGQSWKTVLQSRSMSGKNKPYTEVVVHTVVFYICIPERVGEPLFRECGSQHFDVEMHNFLGFKTICCQNRN